MKKVALHNRGGFIRLASITVDPERDNPGVLKNYAQRMKIETGNWDLLTGTKKDIYRMARNSFLAVATDGDGGPEDFIHSEKLVLIDKQKRIRGFYTGTSDQEVKQLIIDIKKLLHEN
jgi:protein SCO1/2